MDMENPQEFKMHKCRYCGNEDYSKMFDVGVLPLGHPVDYSKVPQGYRWVAELGYMKCKKCQLVQTKHTVPAEQLVQENVILSNVSNIISDHYWEYVSKFRDLIGLSNDDLVVEIGCSDAALLDAFVQQGFGNVLGIEPAPHPFIDYKVELVEDFFTVPVVRRLREAGKVPKLIIANSVILLIPEIDEFFNALDDYMDPGSFFVIEIPYFCDYIRAFRMDCFAHLRANWFTLQSLAHVYSEHNMQFVEIEHLSNFRSGTLRITVQKSECKVDNEKFLQSADEHIRWLVEEENRITSEDFAAEFESKINALRERVRGEVLKFAESGIPVYGYGGGIKASGIINWLGLTEREIKLTVDIDPNKHGRCIPCTEIPIRPVETLFEDRENESIALFVLAMDHLKHIRAEIEPKLRETDRLVQVLPEFKVF